MNQFELPALTLEWLAFVCVFHQDLEKGIVVSVGGFFIPWPSGELLVGRHEGGSHIMGQEGRVSADVYQLDDIFLSDHSTPASLRQLFSRQDLPVIVGIVVRVTGDLLSLTTDSTVVVTERVSIGVRVKESLGILVSDGNGIVESNLLSIQEQFVTRQCLLECWTHETIPRSGVDENLEVNPEEYHVDDEWERDESPCPSEEVAGEITLSERK